MSKFNFTIQHNAHKNKIKEGVEKYVRQYNVSREWKNDYECHFTGREKGKSFSGIVRIKQDDVDFSLKLPLVALLFKAAIKNKVEKEIKKI